MRISRSYHQLALTISALLLPANALALEEAKDELGTSSRSAPMVIKASYLLSRYINKFEDIGNFSNFALASIGDELEDIAEDDVESDVEDDVESDVEDDVESDVEDDVESDVEDDVESDVEDDVESDVEDDVESDVEDDVESDVEDDVESDVEDDVESDVEDDVESDVEDDVESDVEDDVESDVEDDVESDVEGDIESDVEDDVESDVEDDVEDNAEDDVEGEVENDVEDDINDDYENDAVDDIDNDAEAAMQRAVDLTIASASFNHLEHRANQRLEGDIEQRTEADNEKVFSDDWLILNDPNDKDFLVANGYSIISTRFLSSLNKDLIRVEAPATFKRDVEGDSLLMRLNTSERAVDLNHIYELSEHPPLPRAEQLNPQRLISIESPSKRQRVGVIDTMIKPAHPALRSVNITSEDFSESTPSSISSHGNSVVSILVGNSDEYSGLLNNVDVYAASVFFDDDTKGQITTTESLIQSLDWLVSQDIKVINMSLAGPPNMILSAAIDKYCQQGVIIVAAVGNSGPHSKPLFPAAYDCVIGVTAISQNNLIYRRAVRGKQVDIAAYGVNVRAADDNNGYSNVTGTSFATPFVTAQVLSLLPTEPLDSASQQTLMDQLIGLTVDLGEPGKDEIYGFGALIQTFNPASEE